MKINLKKLPLFKSFISATYNNICFYVDKYGLLRMKVNTNNPKERHPSKNERKKNRRKCC